MNQNMLARIRYIPAIISIAIALAISSSGQSVKTAAQRAPSTPTRPFVVMPAQSLSDLERKLQSDNKAEDLIGGEGMQLRVAVQHDKSKPTAAAELHDASDDVYYVLEGTATLTLGGKLDSPGEIEPGEWRSPSINGGQTFQITKGDLIVVPRGTPHQRTGKDFSMILIKIFAAPLPPPKPPTAPTPAASPTPAVPPKPTAPKVRTPVKP
jgi:mannose-6-phosphate isomerase-like protein (cupin superfamily)